MEGLLPIWKEVGMTSHDVVFKLRKILKTKKIGHSGTLDPDVDGVLPVAVGKATKTIEYMMDSQKVYTGEVTFGFSTTTEDASGEIVEQTSVPADLNEEMIDKALQSFIGEIKQTPPMYSAVKVNGKRLYEYARQGITVERPTRKAQIHSFERTSPLVFNQNQQTAAFKFKVECGKGTYVRTLAVDLGLQLGLPSHMSQLTRKASGGFTADQAVTLGGVQELMEANRIEEKLYPLETALSGLEQVEITDALFEKIKNGSLLEKDSYMPPSVDRLVFVYQNKAVAIYAPHPSKTAFIKPVKVLRNEL
ncbi:tRNA pseudouridine synthase B [Alkalibacterium sp. AK22]|uniref:tRNA pseudouridine(55) synthase TruB n=1 Tax=Alkalibacterium sp. AK22 TaxID=1229520 RepID=UPI00044A8BD1|nr:tRNA pseudouridine(55) synthase TruB [Alkalibacterium sp. AK22]EXJ24127.1 tRNA pseudouridine synthase B [Alkalibacterium sp. AK22]